VIIDDGFDVDAPIGQVWPVLKDIPRVATCIPRAEITEVVDERTYRARATIKVGPVEVSYRATITVDEIDDAAHTARFTVKGDEMRGRGGVTASVESKATEHDGITHVAIHTDRRNRRWPADRRRGAKDDRRVRRQPGQARLAAPYQSRRLKVPPGTVENGVCRP